MRTQHVFPPGTPSGEQTKGKYTTHGSSSAVRLRLERPWNGCDSLAAKRGEATELFHHRFASDLARDRVDQLRVVDGVAAAARRIDSEGLREAFNILESSASKQRWVEQHIEPRSYSRSSLLSREFLGCLPLEQNRHGRLGQATR